MFASLCNFARRDPLGFIGLLLVALILFAGLFGGSLAPFSPSKIDVPARLLAPSLDHLMGTDKLGRDVFSRVLAGSALALQIGIVTVGLSVVVGTIFGLIAGYGPRWLDSMLLLIFDTTYSFPTVILEIGRAHV